MGPRFEVVYKARDMLRLYGPDSSDPRCLKEVKELAAVDGPQPDGSRSIAQHVQVSAEADFQVLIVNTAEGKLFHKRRVISLYSS